MKRSRFALTVLVILVLSVAPAVAGIRPAEQAGFLPNASVDASGFDHVNLFSGNLIVTIPGASYPVSDRLAYGFQLVLSSKPWTWENSCNGDLSDCVAQAYPSRRNSVGMGWRVSLAELLGPDEDTTEDNTSGRWVFVSPSGGQHALWPRRHANDCEDPGDPGNQKTDEFLYSRDGSNLRLHRHATASRHFVETADGTIYEFDSSTFDLVRIQDGFSSWVAVSRTSTVDTITDSVGREHRIVYEVHSGADPRAQRTVDQIELMAFGDGTGQRSAVWNLDYSLQWVKRPAPDPAGTTNPLDSTSAKTLVPFLWRVRQPDGSQFRFGSSATSVPWYHLDYTTHNGVDEYRTALPYRMEMPTKGKVEWAWRRYTLPGEPGQSPRSGAWLSSFAGVASRTLFDRGASTPEGTWSYTPELRNETLGDPTTPLVEHVVTVGHPAGHSLKHYFSAAKQDTGAWKDEEFGLPFTKRESSGPRFLSRELVGAGGTALEKVFVRYEGDSPASSDLHDLTNRNTRLVSARTQYVADAGRWASTDLSNPDRFGNHRTTVFDGNFHGVNDRTVFSRYNAGLGGWTESCAGVDPNPSSGFAPWPDSRPWVLGTFDRQDVTESGDTRRTELWFTQKGQLRRTRSNRGAGGSGTDRTAEDVIVDRTYTGANLTQESFYGGDDGTGVPTGDLSALSLSNADYTLNHARQHGVRSSTSFAAFPDQKILDLTIDEATGLPSSTKDIAGVGANLTFDAMGRQTSATPTVPIGTMGVDAYSDTLFTNATASSDAEVSTERKVGSSVHTTSKVVLDGLGRVKTEWRNDEAGTLVGRKRTYHPQGWLASVSVWNDFQKKTEFPGYDPGGRPLKVKSPDGTEVRFAYLGDSRMRRFVEVGGTETTHTELYDRFGRLRSVTDPLGTTATYGYDEASNLVSVAMGVQTRTFTVDNGSFLLSESHPELGADVSYSGYDALGNPRKRIVGTEDGSSDLVFTYDGAGRITWIRQAGGEGRTLKIFQYGSANTTTSAEKGRLVGANRYNYYPYPTTGANHKVKVRTVFEYAGRQGRMSDATVNYYLATLDPDSQFSASPNLSFLWDQTYHALGQRDLLRYPKRVGATEDQPRYQHTVTRGWLSSVQPFGGSLANLDYHPSGTLASIARTNGVVDTQAVDPKGLPRPRSISTTKSGATLWTTGDFAFDPAGNITRMGGSRFTYDPLSRLDTARTCPDGSDPDSIFEDGFESGDTSAWGAGGSPGSSTPCVDGSYGYDKYGNLTSLFENGTGTTWTVSPSTNRASGLAYDSAGNVTGTGCGGFTCATIYDYDDLDMLRRQATAGDERYFIYDAFDEKLITVDWGSSEWFWTVRDEAGKILRSWIQTGAGDPVSHRIYLYRGNQPLGTRNYTTSGDYSGEHHHLHLDHLGSTRLVTLDRDSGVGDGNVVSKHTFLPFGQEWQGSNSGERLRFTGHERLFLDTGGDSDDLDNFHARSYKPGLGRFLSVDPVMVGINDPQALNRYAYVLGNPLKYVDPFGLFPCGDWDCQDEIDVTTPPPTLGPYNQSGFGGFLHWGFFLQSMPMTWGPGGGTQVADSELSALDRLPQPESDDESCFEYRGERVCVCADDIQLGMMPLTPGALVGPGSTIGRLTGRPNPVKLNRAGRLQPYSKATGEYLSYGANPGPSQSQAAYFGAGFVKGFAAASAPGVDLPTAATPAERWGQTLGTLVGGICSR